MFIVIEGPDKTGKTSLINRLKQEQFPDAIYYKDPPDTKLGREIRHVVVGNTLTSLEEIYLFSAARLQTNYKILEERKDNLVICDRWIYSTEAYQIAAKGLSLSEYSDTFNWATLPDLVIILLPADINVLFERIKTCKFTDRFEQDKELIKKIYDYYRQECPGVIIDSGKSKDYVYRQAVNAINNLKWR